LDAEKGDAPKIKEKADCVGQPFAERAENMYSAEYMKKIAVEVQQEKGSQALPSLMKLILKNAEQGERKIDILIESKTLDSSIALEHLSKLKYKASARPRLDSPHDMLLAVLLRSTENPLHNSKEYVLTVSW
jgi:hypothetical protein